MTSQAMVKLADELKPCPFCGGECEIERAFNNFEDARVSCKQCGVAGPVFDNDALIGAFSKNPETDATTHWNTRLAAAPAASGGVRELLYTIEQLTKYLHRNDPATINMDAVTGDLYEAIKSLRAALTAPPLPADGVRPPGWAGNNPDMPEGGQLYVDPPLDWAISRWRAEVKNRPLQNVHRCALDTTWRQVIRYFCGNDRELCGPPHDELVDALAAPHEQGEG